MINRFTFYKQHEQKDCAPTCLRMVARHYGKRYSAQTLREKTQVTKSGVSMSNLANAAESLGFDVVGAKMSLNKLLEQNSFPCILHWNQNHYVVLYKVLASSDKGFKSILRDFWGGDKSTLLNIADPASGLLTLTSKEFESNWINTHLGHSEGLVLFLTPTSRFFKAEQDQDEGIGFSHILSYVLQFKKQIAQLVLSMIAIALLSLGLPFIGQMIIDIGIRHEDLPLIALLLIGQFAIVLGTTVIGYIRTWTLLHISTRLNFTVLSDFISKLLKLPISFFDQRMLGDILQRVGDHQRIEAFFTGQMLSTAFSVINFVLFGAVLLFYNSEIFLVTILMTGVYVCWITAFLKERKKIDKSRFGVESSSHGKIIQLLNGIVDIKLSGAEKYHKQQWQLNQIKLFKWNIHSLRISQNQQSGALVINNIKSIFITYLTAHSVITGDMTLGMMVSVQYIIGQVNAPMEQLVMFIQSWHDAKLSIERLNEIHMQKDEEEPDQKPENVADPKSDIILHNVSFSYQASDQRVLNNIDLTIPQGKVTAIVGSSGSGKTTLLKLLLRFYKPSSGHILLKGKTKKVSANLANRSLVSGNITDLETISHSAWRENCGVVMQDSYIFSETIGRNIAMKDDEIDIERVVASAQAACIHEFITTLPLGYDTVIGMEGAGLSQGQKQRILIARAIYKNPEIIFLDEATNSLDANNEKKIISHLEEFFIGKTVVIVAHRLSTIKNADQIVVMNNGSIVESGTHSGLIELKGFYYRLVFDQMTNAPQSPLVTTDN
jgi:ATP-binding cassette, subfamily B, bacterial